MTKDELYLVCDMLQGNINRMCVTDSIYELEKMELYARKRLGEIFIHNFNRLSENEDESEV